MEEHAEDKIWKTIDPNDIWALDKLILSRKLGYLCGPVGLDVPKPGYYIVRPCVNMLGLGLGAQRVYVENSTVNLPLGFFWCEWFSGRHISVDYHWGKQVLAVEGVKAPDTFTHWKTWRRVDDDVTFPSILHQFAKKYEYINCEFIGNRLIEVHFRRNEDFNANINVFIPVWEGQSTTPPLGYTYRDYPDIHGRIGAFIK
jgi:hypothetical protein